MIVLSLDVNKNPFRPREEDEELLGPEVPHLSAIGALIYLASNTRSDIAFAVNLLTIDLGLFYSSKTSPKLIKSCGISSGERVPTPLYEDNAACIAQLKSGYIKKDKTKHISPKFFFTHELQKRGDIDVQQIRSCDNLADLFTKTLPTTTFKKLVYRIGTRRYRNLKGLPNQRV
ncbi:hypothetical protein M9H77_06295 [Catharanthus roseus]|uniref:Uncharacterized protein n=1 Tax=Catharanthus roseus TaxID=4058 RepID=A0ACC0BRU7_CATRO|nr:hypothetical protein M9H77_06295 [Catharanthus roseus]